MVEALESKKEALKGIRLSSINHPPQQAHKVKS